MANRTFLIQKTDDRGCWWHCDECGTLMNAQLGFTTANDEWTCKECGTVNDVSVNNIKKETN